MTAGKYITYTIDVPGKEIIRAGGLFFHEDAALLDDLVANFCDRFNVDPDTAQEVISERQQLEGIDSDDALDIQLYTARAAKLLGFRGVEVSDEQGAAYMIDMLRREAELVRL
ncbi:hypothetical protein [Pseudomonas putida]|uniref:Uncharacterized protein n=1 Tax=Pseudomonas putida TaxID=303 RepID=A0A1Q9R3B8_PSEPU|nr:hypothetical protein [Pseudomonas putida]OLS61910.1 hypothetical protein PSEMO_32830 [Pseudomonas putida]